MINISLSHPRVFQASARSFGDPEQLKAIRESYLRIQPALVDRLRKNRERMEFEAAQRSQKYDEALAVWQKKVERWERGPKKQ